MNCDYIDIKCSDISCDLCENIQIQAYNKAIDDFINKIEAEIESSAKFIREYDDSVEQKAYYSGLCQSKKIAEQLKAGVKNE